MPLGQRGRLGLGSASEALAVTKAAARRHEARPAPGWLSLVQPLGGSRAGHGRAVMPLAVGRRRALYALVQ